MGIRPSAEHAHRTPPSDCTRSASDAARRYIDETLAIQRRHGHEPSLTDGEYRHAVAEIARWTQRYLALAPVDRDAERLAVTRVDPELFDELMRDDEAAPR